MRLIFLNRYYWPEEPATAQLLTDLADALAAAGHEVTVITSRPGGSALGLRQTHGGVTISRVTSTRWARHGLPGKAADFLTFYIGALLRLAFTAQRGDTVVTLTDPPLLGIGAWLTARLCGARIFHWVQDVYPEIAATLTGHSWLRVIQPLRDLAWRRSDGCVTLGQDMAVSLADAGVPAARIHVVSNWAPAGLTVQPRAAADALRTAWQLEGRFVVAYSGNLGRVHDLGPVLDLAGALRDEPGIAFVFIGGGAQRPRLEAEAAKRGLTSVQFHPAQPRAELAASIALGDLHLVTLLPGCERLVFPSKLYGVAAVGRPVFFIGPPACEIAALVTARGLGRAFGRDEIAGMAGAIRAWRADAASLAKFSAAAADFGREHSGPARAVAAWEKLLVPAD
jgi:colanic acid biosynthesis glycosyl transferase WcaI